MDDSISDYKKHLDEVDQLTKSTLPKGDRLQALMQEKKEIEIISFHPPFVKWLFGTAGGILILLISILTFGCALVFLIPVYISQRFTNYTITNQRIIVREGLLVRKEDDIELYRIKDIKCSVSLLNRITGIGDLTITSSEVGNNRRHHTLFIEAVPHPSNTREMLRSLTENARRKKGVKEIDWYSGDADA